MDEVSDYKGLVVVWACDFSPGLGYRTWGGSRSSVGAGISKEVARIVKGLVGEGYEPCYLTRRVDGKRELDVDEKRELEEIVMQDRNR